MADGQVSWFERLRSELRRTTGVILDADRQYSTEARLAPVARATGYADVDSLCRAAFIGRNREAATAIVDAMMTNETFFFRDRAPFEHLRDSILPALIKSRAATKSIRIWCAACATGQEPYSVAMVVDEKARQLAGWRVEILATDISQTALNIARAGAYNQFQVQRGLPVSEFLRHFVRDESVWAVAEHLRERVRFEQANLLEDFSDLGEFDLIFCRNVMLYFDQFTKHALLRRLGKALAPNGYLVLGATESALGSTRSLSVSPRCPWLARKEDEAAAPALRLVKG
ncbi:MAG: chemotaxis protein CheR [Hyphomicrobiales bacterium]|nr:chemotaxis protein CheR [Hyphomicrobiales bacterium]